VVLRYNYTLARCFHKTKIKLEQLGKNTFRILCTGCHKEIWRWTKYTDDIYNLDEKIAKTVFIMGKPTELSEQEKQLLI
jgi:hypothetical protein